ncbi:flagellar biosynthetic protein FliO [Desulfosarcina sp.]|uniref:flagellar biosynthetic protein FliO n=1 Tax=Desulfosarcina sp. TaxID=2027861 RepID=UPI003970CE5D
MNGTPDMLAAGLKMIASLGVVLAMILCLLYGIRKLTNQRMGAGGAKQIHVLDSHYMGVKKSISLVRVPGKVLVLGITGDRINLLDTLDDDVVRQQMPVDQSKSFGPMLSERLKKLGNGFKGKENR